MHTFQQHLPFLPPSTTHAEQKLIPTTHHGSQIAQTRSAAAAILFVDDDTAVLEAYSLLLEELGYAVHTANSGEEALDFLETHAVDAVVVDYLMPGMDGEESARRIRSLRFGIPIILFSGSLPLSRSGLGVFDACVDKGLGAEALVETLECLLHPEAAQSGQIR